jgi:hypothetical protein
VETLDVDLGDSRTIRIEINVRVQSSTIEENDDEMVRDGRMPKAKRIPKAKRSHSDNLPLLINTKQACNMLFGNDDRKNFYRLYTMIKRGEISTRKLGDRWFIPRAEMQQFLDDPKDGDAE